MFLFAYFMNHETWSSYNVQFIRKDCRCFLQLHFRFLSSWRCPWQAQQVFTQIFFHLSLNIECYNSFITCDSSFAFWLKVKDTFPSKNHSGLREDWWYVLYLLNYILPVHRFLFFFQEDGKRFPEIYVKLSVLIRKYFSHSR